MNRQRAFLLLGLAGVFYLSPLFWTYTLIQTFIHDRQPGDAVCAICFSLMSLFTFLSFFIITKWMTIPCYKAWKSPEPSTGGRRL